MDMMIIATVVIAISSVISCIVASLIHKSTQKRDEEMKDIVEKLIAATLVSGRGIGSETMAAGLFHIQLKALREHKNESN